MGTFIGSFTARSCILAGDSLSAMESLALKFDCRLDCGFIFDLVPVHGSDMECAAYDGCARVFLAYFEIALGRILEQVL